MKEYILTAILATVVVGASGSVTHGSFKKVSSAAFGIILALVFLTPLLSLGELSVGIPELPSFPDTETENGYAEAAEKAFCEGICLALADEFTIDGGDTEVSVSGFQLEKMRAEAVYITLRGKSVTADIPGIRRYVIENFLIDGGKCEVGIEIGKE